MVENKKILKIRSLYDSLIKLLSYLDSPLLLLLRLYWGYGFFEAGKGKLMNLDRTVGFFTQINIPLPKLNAILAGSTECFGGLLLLVGLGSRLISIPLAFTMVVAYLTAHREELAMVFSDPEKFIGASPFLFLLVSLIVMIFGPGLFSLDTLIGRIFPAAKKRN